MPQRTPGQVTEEMIRQAEQERLRCEREVREHDSGEDQNEVGYLNMLTSNILSNLEEHLELTRSHSDLSSLQASNKSLLHTLRQDLLYIAGDPGSYAAK